MRHHLAKIPLATRAILGVSAFVLVVLLIASEPLIGLAVTTALLWAITPELFRPSCWRRWFGR